MEKHRSCASCGSANHHVADFTTYKQGMKSFGCTPEEEGRNETEEHEFYSGLIIKIGAGCFFSAIKKVISEWTVLCFGRQ